jgi:hypothetical protein
VGGAAGGDVAGSVTDVLPTAAEVPADAGAALASDAAGVSAGEVVGVGAAIVGAAISIATEVVSSMPDDEKAVMVALDVVGAVGSVFTYGLSFIATTILKIALGGLWTQELSHRQREAIETARTLQAVAGMPRELAYALWPSGLYARIAHWGSGYTGGTSGTAVIVDYDSPRFHTRADVGTPYDARPATITVPIGDPADFLAADAQSVRVAIQAGVTPQKLDDADARIRTVIVRQLTLLQGAVAGDSFSLRVLAHVWALLQPPITWDIDAAIDPAIDAEVPYLGETIRALYYTHIAQAYGFAKYSDLMAMVLQSRWAVYRQRYLDARAAHLAHPGSNPPTVPSWVDFQLSLGYHDFRQLRRDVFRGVLGTGGNDHMFELISNRMDAIEHNAEVLTAAVNANAAVFTTPGSSPPFATVHTDSQGVAVVTTVPPWSDPNVGLNPNTGP